jgi:hypothetical protein
MGKWCGPESNAQHNGAPKGNRNHLNGLEWKGAIKRALSKKGSCDRAETLYKIAEKLVECALDSTNPHFQFAVKEIGLRLDGKPTTLIGVSTDEFADAGTMGISASYQALAQTSTPKVIQQDR